MIFIDTEFFECQGSISGDEVGGFARFKAMDLSLHQNGVSADCLFDGRLRRLQNIL